MERLQHRFKRRTGLELGLALAGIIPALSAVASAAPFLSVDFNHIATPTSPTEAGPPAFQAFDVPDGATAGPMTQTYSVSDPLLTATSVTVRIASGTTPTATANLLSRDRGAIADNGTFTYGDLYRDIAIATGTNTTLTLGISGLNPNAPYDVTLYAYDNNNGGTVTLTNTTGGATAPAVSYTYTNGAANFTGGTTPNDVFCRTLRVTSDATGALTFTSNTNFNGSQGLLNGFQISTVPEPTVGLAAIGGLGLLAGCRRVRRR